MFIRYVLYVQLRDFLGIFPQFIRLMQRIPDLGEEGIIVMKTEFS